MKILQHKRKEISSSYNEICVKMTVSEYNEIFDAVDSATLYARDINSDCLIKSYEALWRKLYVIKIEENL